MSLLLTNRDFRIFFLSMFGANTGYLLMTITQGWVLFDITGSATGLGLTTGATSLVGVVFLFIGGALGDRYNQTEIVSRALILPGIIVVFVSLHLHYTTLRLWHAVLVSLLSFSAFSMREPVRIALLPRIVEKQDLLRANGALEVNIAVARIIAPIAGTYVYQKFGVGAVYLIGSGIMIISGVITSRIRVHQQMTTRTGVPLAASLQTIVTDFKAAFVYLMNTPLVKFCFGVVLLMGGLCWPLLEMIPVVVKENLHAAVTEFAHMRVGVAIGSLATGITLSLMSLRGTRKKVIALLVFVSALFMALFGYSTHALLSLLLITITSFTGTATAQVITTVLQENVPENVRSKVFSLQELAYTLPRIASLYMGPLVSLLGIHVVFTLGPVLTVVGVLILLFVCV